MGGLKTSEQICFGFNKFFKLPKIGDVMTSLYNNNKYKVVSIDGKKKEIIMERI